MGCVVAKIEKILAVEWRVKNDGTKYPVTIAIVSGDECEGWGDRYRVGDGVEKFFDDRYNRAKFRYPRLTWEEKH